MADFIVTNNNDSGAGSLRQAIADAAASPDTDDNITFDPALAGQTITLLSPLLWSNAGNLTIDGDTDGVNGVASGEATGITISGGGTTRILDHFGTEGTDSLTLTNLTLADGFEDDVQPTSTILSNGDLTLDNVLFTGNTAEGADILVGDGSSADVATLIFNAGRLSLNDVIFDDTNVVTGGSGADPFPLNGVNGGLATLILNIGNIVDNGVVVFGGVLTGGDGGDGQNPGDGGNAVGIQNFGTVENMEIETNDIANDFTVTAGAGGSGGGSTGAAGTVELKNDDVGSGSSFNVNDFGGRAGTFDDDPFLQALGGEARGFAGNDFLLDIGGGSELFLGGTGRDTVDGGAGIDTIRGGADDDLLEGGAGSDFIFGDGGDDIIVIRQGDDGAGPETINGGTEVDTLRVAVETADSGTFDFTNDNVTGIERFQVQAVDDVLPAVNVILSKDQLPNGFFAAEFGVLGVNGDNAITFTINTTDSFDLSSVTFDNFGDANDKIVVNIIDDGSSILLIDSGVADEIIGSGNIDFITLAEGGGTDTVRAAGGNDVLEIQNGSSNTTGETFDGGANSDVLVASFSTNALFDFSDDTISDFETFRFSDRGSNTANVSLILNASQLSGSGANRTGEFEVNATATADNISVILNADETSLNLGGLTFDNFFEGGGSFVVQGDDTGNSITGGTLNDEINGGGGVDTLNGGGGIDTLRGEAGDDIFRIADNDAEAANDTYDGGADTDAVVLGGDGTVLFDLNNATFHSIERFVLEDTDEGGELTLLLSSNQFGLQPGMGMQQGISSTAEFELDGFSDNFEIIRVDMRGTTLDLSGLTFLGETTEAVFELQGDGHTSETITGTSIRDIITGGGSEADTLNGGGGDDLIQGSSAGDLIDGGTNDADGDTVTYEGSSVGVRVNLDTGRGRGGDAEGDLISNVENLRGSSQNDALTGDGDANVLTGGLGIDTVLAGGGADSLDGNGGNDRLFGLDGNDTINGGDDDDFALGGNNDDVINGDGGADRLLGNNGNDTLSGGDESDTLNGGGGADSLLGGDGIDDLTGGGANDVVEGGIGDDIIKGGSGLDTLRGDAGNDNLFGDVGSDALFGGDNDDILNGFQGIDTLNGENGNDTLSGGDNADFMDGGADDDVLRGQSGNDTLIGGTGADNLNGGDNNDILIGGTENDFLIGGDGNDTFAFAAGDGFDQIDDFDDLGTDVVNIASFGFTDFATEVQANFVVAGVHVDLVLGDDTLRFRNTDVGDLVESDFVLDEFITL